MTTLAIIYTCLCVTHFAVSIAATVYLYKKKIIDTI